MSVHAQYSAGRGVGRTRIKIPTTKKPTRQPKASRNDPVFVDTIVTTCKNVWKDTNSPFARAPYAAMCLAKAYQGSQPSGSLVSNFVE